MHFVSNWNNLLKCCLSADFLLMECYAQGALRKQLHIAPFVECFKTATLGKSSCKSCHCLEKFVKALYFCWLSADSKLYTRCSAKAAAHCVFCRAL